MNEALLHFIWKYKLTGLSVFKGTKNEVIEVVSLGEHNYNSGPDFFNSKVKIDDVLLAGNVELHVKSSDWRKHNHQNDKSYDNLILHVVYEHDQDIIQNINNSVPVLELKPYIKPEIINQYKTITLSKDKIPCGKSISQIDSFVWKAWLDRLLIERLEVKTEYLNQLTVYYKNDYESVLYTVLFRNFGFKINNDPFELLAKNLPYNFIKKYKGNSIQIEALLFGTAGLLDDVFEDSYPKLLQNEFEFLKHKHAVIPVKKELWKFSKTRPANFPTIRLAQLAAILNSKESLFHLIENKATIKELKEFFTVEVNGYWKTHFLFDIESSESEKTIGDDSFYAIVINIIVPFSFFLSKQLAKEDLQEYAFDLLDKIPAEVNGKTKEFLKLGIKNSSAADSQAQIHLLDNFCLNKRCFNCNVAEYLLKNA